MISIHRWPGFCISLWLVVLYYVFIRNPVGMDNQQKMQPSIHPILQMGQKSTKQLEKVLNDKIREIIQHKFHQRKKNNISSNDLVSDKVLIFSMENPTGENTLSQLITGHARGGNYLVYGGGAYEKVDSFSRGQKYEFADLLCHPGAPPAIFTRRKMFFVDFRNFGCSPFYINMIGDPIKEFFYAFQDHWKKHKKRKSSILDAFEDCLTKDNQECSYSGIVPKNRYGGDEIRYTGSIPYFCGDSELCRNLGNPQALQQAKTNIENNFLVVGTQEMWMEFTGVLQCKLPNYFQGIQEYKTSILDSLSLPNNIVKELKKRLEPEYNLYEFISKRLANQYGDCL